MRTSMKLAISSPVRTDGIDRSTAGCLAGTYGHSPRQYSRRPCRMARLYGRGAVDAKGPLAAFICATARSLLKSGNAAHRRRWRR